VRIEGANGNRITLADVSNVKQKYLLTKLQTLDHDADGCICLDDLLMVMDSAARLRSTTQWYRLFILVYGIAVVLMFGVSLGSSILSVSLMEEFAVKKGSLVGTDGKTLLVGSSDFVVVNGALHSNNASNGMSLQAVMQQPVINNVLPNSALRRLANGSSAREDDSDGVEMYHVPRADFNRAIAVFKSGTVGLSVPLGSDHVSVTLDSSHMLNNGEEVKGSAVGGKLEWTSQCVEGEDKCDIRVIRSDGNKLQDEYNSARLLMARARYDRSRHVRTSALSERSLFERSNSNKRSF